MHALPRLLADVRPAPGLVKADYTDFQVSELPLYPAAGAGTHTYFLIEKAGLGTLQAVQEIAQALNARRRDIGYAGLKDARAVTRQWLSIEHVDAAAVRQIELPRLRVLEVTRHHNKLRLGHLKGNRFLIKVRQTEPERLAELQEGLATLTRRGVPNYFGQQRFGGRGDTWAVGRALLHGDPEAALDLVLGRPAEGDRGTIRQARQLYEHGKYEQAISLWPGMFRDERRALKALARSRGNKRRGLAAIDKATRQFYVSAYQSLLFNQVAAVRVKEGLDQIWRGDLAWLHASGAVFRVEDPAAEQPRADVFEISASGPLFGYRMTEPTGRAGEFEASLLVREGLSKSAFRSGPLRVKGGRRPVRFRPEQTQIGLGADAHGAYLELSFTLPRGCYATALLRELFVGQAPSARAAAFEGAEASPD